MRPMIRVMALGVVTTLAASGGLGAQARSRAALAGPAQQEGQVRSIELSLLGGIAR